MGWFGSAGAWFRPSDSVERLKPGTTVGLSVGARALKLDAGVMFYPSYAGVGGGLALLIPFDERPVSIGIDVEVGVVGAYAGVGVYSSFPLGLLLWRDKIRDKLLTVSTFLRRRSKVLSLMPVQRWDTTTERGLKRSFYDLEVVDAVVLGGPAGRGCKPK